MKFLHNILKGISLTGALFVFQACYGTPQPYKSERGEAPMSFTLLSKETGQPLQGIEITARSYQGAKEYGLGYTNASGKCRVKLPYQMDAEGPYVSFRKLDSDYIIKDTLIADLRDRDIVVKLNHQ